jgi:hypothetical protein
MKHLKIFEEITDGKPRVGCYIIGGLNENTLEHTAGLNYFNNNIGKIIGYSKSDEMYNVNFNLDSEHNSVPYGFANPSNWRTSEIAFWSTHKESCEKHLLMKDEVKKYNL